MHRVNHAERRSQIITLREQSSGIHDIARSLNISRTTVRLWIVRYGEEGHTEDRRCFNHASTTRLNKLLRFGNAMKNILSRQLDILLIGLTFAYAQFEIIFTVSVFTTGDTRKK